MKLKAAPILVTLISIACLVGAVTYNQSQMPPRNQPMPEGGANQPPMAKDQASANGGVPSNAQADLLTAAKQQILSASAPSIVVVEATAGNYKALVKGYGEAAPHYAITYSAEVSGRVKALNESFETGRLVKKGDVLAELENTSYLQAVASAKSDLAQAQLDLLEEQRTGEQARLEWERSGISGEPNSPLVLREPQLAAAQAVVENTKYTLQKAKEDLAKTVIKAPFDALVVERNIQPGSYVQAGTTVAELYSTDFVEVDIPLSEKQWQNLPKLTNTDLLTSDEHKWPVTLYSSDGEHEWQGYVSRVKQHVDTTSRQRSIVIRVDHPFEQEIGLFPGTFVQAHIEGANLENTWQLPASAISQQGDIWYVTQDNHLKKVPAKKVFERAESVYVLPIDDVTSARVVKRPLSNYVEGMAVTPKVEG